jgi:nucleotide-binding universal stress UspA family protein
VLSSAGLDVVRWRRARRGVTFWLGVITTLMVLTAWLVNLVTKQLATVFGGSLVAIGMMIAVMSQQRRFHDFFFNLPIISRLHTRRIRTAELESEEVPELLSVGQAIELLPLYPSKTLVCLRGRNPALLKEAILRERGRGGTALYSLYVDERPGLFAGGAATSPGEEGIETLRFATEVAQKEKFPLIPVWTISYNAAEAIARVAEQMDVDTVMVGVSRRSALYHLLRGHVVNGLARRLPRTCHLLLYS